MHWTKTERQAIGKPILLLGGYYDVFRKADLRAELAAIEPHSDVVLDLATTDQLDCGSLGLMVARLREWRKEKPQTNLRLINVSTRIARVLTILGLDTLFIVSVRAA